MNKLITNPPTQPLPTGTKAVAPAGQTATSSKAMTSWNQTVIRNLDKMSANDNYRQELSKKLS